MSESEQFTATVAPSAELDAAAEGRLADLSGFTRGVVHDLRNPLNVIVANIYLLRQRLAGADARTMKPVDRVADQVRALEHLLNGYLAFEQAKHPFRQRIQVNEVVQAVAESLPPGDGINVELDLDETLPQVQADPRLLDSALRALVRNATRAMGSEGTLRLQTRSGAGTVLLSVEDTGPGIPPDVLPRVFEPFFSTWEEHAGVGLALVSRVARAHEGSCRLYTTPGEGTRVELELPVEP
jgi:signal transduction histidine kinase